MQIQLLKSKIHKARITEAVLHYEGSLGIDLDLMDQCGIRPYEKIQVVNITNGERIETYAIPETRGSRTFCLNGAAARRGARGDSITIMVYGLFTEAEADAHKPRILILDQDNAVVETKGCD